MDYESVKILLLVVAGGVVYFIISNTLWLFLGARFLQFLPGVGDKSFLGTLKLVAMLVAVVIGIAIFIIKLFTFQKPNLKEQISISLKFSSLLIYKLKNKVETRRVKKQ